MTADNPRLRELRRRLQTDPASIAFALLAEECRRAGDADEAVAVCLAGLAFHPGYLSARVTLGRALSELGRLDEARGELAIVLAAAPHNLAANRAMAEVHQRQENTETPVSIEDLFDFDTLIERLGGGTEPKPASPQAIDPGSPVASELDQVELQASDSDPFALLERHLREGEEQRAAETQAAVAARQREEKTVAELEDRITAIVTDPNQVAS